MCTGARCGLLAGNIILMLIAVTCIAGGSILIIGKAVYYNSLEFLRSDLRVSAAAVRGDTTLNVSQLDVQFITLPLGIVLLIVGVFLTILTILGLIAACVNFYKFTVFYMVILICLFFSQIVVIICVYIDRKPFDNTVKLLLKSTLRSFTDINGEDSLTLGWNAVMSFKKCCGVDNYSDFVIAGYPKVVKSGTTNPTAETPQICCIDKGANKDCVTNANFKTLTYYQNGCYQHIWDYVTSETGLIIFAVFFIVIAEFLCLFFSAWLICYRRKLGTSKVSNYE